MGIAIRSLMVYFVDGRFEILLQRIVWPACLPASTLLCRSPLAQLERPAIMNPLWSFREDSIGSVGKLKKGVVRCNALRLDEVNLFF